MVLANNEIDVTKNAGKSTTISTTMRMRRCDAQLLASNYSTFRALVISDNFIPQNGPSTQLINASFKCEMPRLELKSSRSFLAIKRCQRTKGKTVIN